MNIRELKEMLQLMADHELTEMEVEKDGLKVKLKKGASGTFVPDELKTMVSPIPVAPQPTIAAAQPGGAPSAPAPQDDAGAIIVRSPMVGTFYAAPAPDQPPYVTVGKTIKEGDVLCIVEAMKLMNEIKSEVGGVISEILVENGQPVEFDQPLFKIKKP